MFFAQAPGFLATSLVSSLSQEFVTLITFQNIMRRLNAVGASSSEERFGLSFVRSRGYCR
jgi:hypothetical protein